MPERGRVSFARGLLNAAIPLLYFRGWGAVLAYGIGLHGSMRVDRFRLALPGRGGTRPPLRLVFASDFHAGPTTDPRLIARACTLIEQERPDLLLLGGDLVSFRAAYVEPLAERLGSLRPPLGTFAVLGNHDLVTDVSSFVERLERRGIEVLVNENVRLAPPFDDVWVCGFDDATRGRPDAERAFAGATGTRIVLAHAPATLAAIGAARFELMLAGHTHGGQVALPGGRPLYLPRGPYNRAYARGRFAVGAGGRATLLVSRGIGCSNLPIRLFADPDILVCELCTGAE
ncbi:MAG TPA: metallophosphoesterase [Gemmatimonadaceae bacterium]|nr:metallophosphoesterase [Gemmatimonadaceae bacterium]